MPNTQRVLGLPNGGIDPEKREVHFTLELQSAGKLDLLAAVGVAEQVTSGLARMVSAINSSEYAKGREARTTAAEKVTASHVQVERWSKTVLLRLVTESGVPYTFALTPEAASGIAEQLKNESGRIGPVGSA